MIDKIKADTNLTKGNGHFWGKLDKLDDQALQKIIRKFFDRD
jgi:hypothetical protein